jgi:hypothetical protein
MTRLYITIIILQFIGMIALINMYENTISELQDAKPCIIKDTK